MSPIITQSGPHTRSNPGMAGNLDAAARRRRDRLARATADQMESALAFLSAIGPEAFEIAFTAAGPSDGELPEDEISEDEEPFPVCRDCGAPVGIFLARGPRWQHFRGDGATSGAQEIYDPGHPAEVTWLLLPGETPEGI